MAASSLNIPHFLRASSPRGLMRVMLSNNLRHGKQFKYDIMKDGSNWTAWFITEAANVEHLTRALNGDKR